MCYYTLPFLVAMCVAMDNGIEVGIGYQIAIWMQAVGGTVIDIIKLIKRK